MKTRLLVALMILASLLLTVSGSAAARANPQSGIPAPAPNRSGKPAENPQAVVLGQSGTSFAYSQTFGSLQTPYLADTSHLNYPWGIATDGTNVLIGELAGHRVLTYTSAGTWVSTLGQPGITYGDGNFSGVFDMAVDGSGTTWVAENGRAEIYQFDSGGNYLGEFKDGSFEHPSGIAFDAAGNVYVSDGGTTWSDDQGRQVVGVYDSSGNLLSTIGVADTSGSGNDKFHGPQHIAVYANMLYVADGGNNRVQIFDITDPTKPVYSATLGVTGEYGSDNTHLSQPVGVAVDASSIYVADRWNNRVQVFSRSTHVYAATLGSGSGTGDDQFSNPSDVAVDSSGNLYVADYDNNRVQQFNSSFVYQRTYGVTGVPYLTDAYHYNYPSGIAAASDGSFYVTEDTGQRLIKLDAAGGVEWTLGTAGVAVSPMTNSSFNQPTDVALDSSGNVYVADQWNQRVQEYDSGGNYLATLGLGAGNYEFQEPAGLAIGPNGYIYVADSGRNRVQVFDASRNYLATLGETDVSGTDNAHFNWPRDVAVDSNGQLYVMD
ncbi:MAG TPA: NHL repeat-containing protein, partial [Anaerolineales bacterium]|nr:NHL repeat-containing protein [Anaerolineales bacterium]